MAGGQVNPVRVSLGGAPGAGFNSYAAGRKHYGMGRSAPNVGKTANKVGYGQRDASAANRLDALQRRLQGGNF